jgi:hypothetical protein
MKNIIGIRVFNFSHIKTEMDGKFYLNKNIIVLIQESCRVTKRFLKVKIHLHIYIDIKKKQINQTSGLRAERNCGAHTN